MKHITRTILATVGAALTVAMATVPAASAGTAPYADRTRFPDNRIGIVWHSGPQYFDAWVNTDSTIPAIFWRLAGAHYENVEEITPGVGIAQVRIHVQRGRVICFAAYDWHTGIQSPYACSHT